MPSKYVKKTNQRRYADRKFSIRAVHRPEPDLEKLCEALIRLTLQEVQRGRAEREATRLPETLRPLPAKPPSSPKTNETGPTASADSQGES